MRQDTAHVPENGGAAPVAPNDTRRLHGSIAHDIAVAIIAGRFDDGVRMARELITAAERHFGPTHPETAAAYRALAWVPREWSRTTRRRILPATSWRPHSRRFWLKRGEGGVVDWFTG